MSIIVQFNLKTCIKLFLTGAGRWLSFYTVKVGVVVEHEIITLKDIVWNWLYLLCRPLGLYNKISNT